ncbi:hypothetical protein AB1O35_001670 [Escherichia coli]
MLHRMSIHLVVQEAVPERLLMIPNCIKIFLFAIRMDIIYVEKKTNALGVVVTYAQTARDDAE